MEQHKYTNDLINETSPYLLQHAHNPVDWKPWNKEALQQAKDENKLIIISIGYAACHWCHVMEHESFESPEVAEIMNTKYINIKVDREERPDIDQVYMSAVQLMTGSGGWPLNVVALPDGRPVWGGTYFPKDNWTEALNKISSLFQENPETEIKFEKQFIEEAVSVWQKNFDYQKGGTQKTPKFMMPNNYHFLLRYAHQTNNKELLDYVDHTLKNISFGGVYDHVGGGFSRYSTDDKWHVPHFEKMLYDNAQLVSLYSDAYLLTKNNWYKDVVYETLDFVNRELTGEDGAFYSSLDADSLTPEGELEEGAFYVWKKEELKTLLEEDFELFADYYNVNSYGNWEKGNYVLIRKKEQSDFIAAHGISEEELSQKLTAWRDILLTKRSKRSRPRLDDKTLTSWNALMLKGYLDAYRVFKEPEFLTKALKNANFLKKNQIHSDNALYHNYKAGKSSINGYLEDYAAVIDSFISLYETTGDMQWLEASQGITAYTFDHFYDPKQHLFYFTSDQDPKLINRTIEYSDNVIPASNSIMAKNLWLLSHYLYIPKYAKVAKEMLHIMQPQIEQYPSGYSNWLDLMTDFSFPFYEVVIIGKNTREKVNELNNHYIPNKLLAFSEVESNQPLFESRYSSDQTLIYICVNNACKYPVQKVSEALKFME